MISAVVLGGSQNNGPLRESVQVDYEALLPLGKKVMVEYVVEALLLSRHIRRIVVVGPAKELSSRMTDPRITVTGIVGDVIDNLNAGVTMLPEEKRVLIVTSDVPLLTASAVDSFIDAFKEGYHSGNPNWDFSAVKKAFGAEVPPLKIFGEYAGKDLGAAALLAFFLGTFGIHWFYLERQNKGILYLMFCWTGVPTVLGFIDGFGFLRRINNR